VADIPRLAAGDAVGAAAAGPREAVLRGAPTPAAGCGRARGRGIRFGPPGRLLAGPFSGVFSATFSAAFSFGFAAIPPGAAVSARPLRSPAITKARTAAAPMPVK
jgi:hypothetical protein